MIFAQLPQAGGFEAIGWLMVTAASLMFGVNQVLKVVDRFRGKQPQPPNRQLEASHRELERRVTTVEGKIDDIWGTMRDEDKSIRAEIAVAVAGVQATISRFAQDTERALGRLEGKIDALSQDS